MPVSSENWLLARTQPHREAWAAENVARLKAEFYLPKILEVERYLHKGVRRRSFRVRPLFPGYLFVRPYEGQWHALLDAFGISGLVLGTGGYPGVIRDSGVAAIRAMEVDGVVVLPKEPKESFQPNQPVRITQGAYAGFKGLVKGANASDRIQVLLEYMGRKVPFIVRSSDLEAVTAA